MPASKPLGVTSSESFPAYLGATPPGGSGPSPSTGAGSGFGSRWSGGANAGRTSIHSANAREQQARASAPPAQLLRLSLSPMTLVSGAADPRARAVAGAARISSCCSTCTPEGVRGTKPQTSRVLPGHRLCLKTWGSTRLHQNTNTHAGRDVEFTGTLR